MRGTFSLATVLAIGAGVSGAGASLSLLGSDTLFKATQVAITNAGASTLVYLGSGSSNGEAAAIRTVLGTTPPGPQQIIPMTAMLSNKLCGSSGIPLASQQTAEGIVIGLDGVAVVGSAANAGASACNGTPDASCGAQAAGAAYSTTVATATHGNYAFTSWRDVLSVLYGGKSHAGWSEGTSCSSDIRTTIANSWADLFQTQCAGSDPNQGCSAAVQTTAQTGGAGTTAGLWSTNLNASGAPTGGIQHAFRRDDGATTSNVFASLIGLSTPSATSNNNFGSTPFCNAIAEQIGTTNPPPAPKAAPGTIVHYCNASWNNCNLAASSTAAVSIGYPPTDYQDNDPIRRACIGTGSLSGNRASEQVCDRDGTLGLVVPVTSSDYVSTNGGTQYPVGKCNGGAIFGEAPIVINSSTGRTAFGRCPNGDLNFGGGSCGIPVDGTGGGGNNGSTACMTDNSFRSPFSVDASTPLNGVAPSAADGRVYNAHVFAGLTYTGLSNNQYVRDTIGRQLQGAFYRIHSARPAIITSSPYALVSCTASAADDQVACLTQASPCSIGFGGKEVVSWGANQSPPIASNVAALKINQIDPAPACIAGSGSTPAKFIYPFSRKLYLNSIVGFGNLSGLADDPANDQLKLAEYEGRYAGTGNNGIDDVLAQQKFVLVPSTVNGGQPFCEDYNEQMVCATPATANVNGCQASPPAGIPGQGGQTTCGNAVVENYEDCDNGTAGTSNAINGGNVTTGAPGTCSTTCRLN
jgi:hypothetical protein